MMKSFSEQILQKTSRKTLERFGPIYPTFNKIQTSCSFGSHVGGKSCPPNCAHINPTNLMFKKSNCYKISPLDGSDLTFGMYR